MPTTITGTGIKVMSRRRRLAAATVVAACVCAAPHVATPAGAQQDEAEASQTKAAVGLKFDAPLKVCKVAGPGIPIGTKSTFDLYDQPANHFTVAAGPAPGGYCVLVGHFHPGSPVPIKELTPPGTKLVDVSISPVAPLAVDLAARKATPTIHAGMNVVTFTNAKVATGYLEICKRVLGKADSPSPYRFDFDGTKVDVAAGTCSPPMLTSVGTKTITEAPRPGSKLQVCSTEPAGALLSCNKAARKAKVVVAAGDVSKETMVTFTNGRRTRPGYLNICKVAGLHTAIGQHFPMLVRRPDGTTEVVFVNAGPAPNGTCVKVGPFALGESVTVADLQSQYFLWTESLLGAGTTGPSPFYITESNGSGAGARPAGVRVTMVAGPNRVTFRNDCPFPGSAPCLP